MTQPEITPFMRKEHIVRWLGIAETPQALDALAARLIAEGNHLVRIPNSDQEASINARWNREKGREVSPNKPIDSGQPIWALTRQASVFKVTASERGELLALANRLWTEAHETKGGKLRVDNVKKAQARALFARAREFNSGRPTLAFFLNARRTKVQTQLI